VCFISSHKQANTGSVRICVDIVAIELNMSLERMFHALSGYITIDMHTGGAALPVHAGVNICMHLRSGPKNGMWFHERSVWRMRMKVVHYYREADGEPRIQVQRSTE
jgi:hypothetical protein